MPPKIPINREMVLNTALRLVNERGVDGLTMRALAAELDIEAPSLYKHVANKGEILDGVCELVYGQVTIGELGDGWDGRLKAYARAFRASLLANRNVVAVLATRPVATEASMVLVEASLREFADAGVDADSGRRLLDIVVAFIIGHVLAEVGSPMPGAAEYEELEQFRARLDADHYPMSREALVHRPNDRDHEFELALDVLVAGFVGLFEGLRPPSDPPEPIKIAPVVSPA